MFYFVRHGKTDYSEKDTKIYQGFGVHLAGLSPEGIRQIQQSAKDERLQGTELILSSPYTRAVQTAALLAAELKVPVVIETELHEWMANKAYVYEPDETADRAYEEYRALGGRYPQGETRPWEEASAVRARVLRVLEKYRGYGKVAVAAHGMMMEAVTGRAHPENGDILEVDLDQGPEEGAEK